MRNTEMVEVLKKIAENGDTQLYEEVYASFTAEMTPAEIMALEQDLQAPY